MSNTQNSLLKNTHRYDGICILKARDYYFDIARRLNKFKSFLMFAPPLILALSYIGLIENLSTFKIFIILNNYRDFLMGAITFIAFVLTRYIQIKINKNLNISNTLREEYDVRICSIDRNPFYYNYKKLDKYIEKAKYVKDSARYETWYSEITSDNIENDIICAQMDNCLYTYFAYTDNIKRIKSYGYIVGFTILSALFALFYMFINPEYRYLAISTVLFIFAMIDILFHIFELIFSMTDLISLNRNIVDKVIELAESNQFNDASSTNEDKLKVIRCIQDCIVSSREQSVFIPKRIRKKHLKLDSPYFKELDEIKYLILSNSRIPESADEIPVLEVPCGENHFHNVDNSNSLKTTKLSEVHSRLSDMLNDISPVWDYNKISYTLDGGTLIGAIREKSNFIFWDDDIDLLIPYEQVELAKELIAKNFSDKYEIQDCSTDKYYTPRLANFRIREKNDLSITCEKDSPLYDKYRYRGIFIDVYAYSPIIINPDIDKIYRKIFLHPRNKYLSFLENKMVHSKTAFRRSKSEKYFFVEKKAQLRSINRYCKLAKNNEYVSYTPNYIYDFKNSGPYIESELIVNRKTHTFAGNEYYIPSNPQKVLEYSYGSGWDTSPHVTKDELCHKFGKENWFSNNQFSVSALKHLTYITLR